MSTGEPAYSALAQRYWEIVRAAFPHKRLAEDELIPAGAALSVLDELAWQSRWFSGDFGREFTATDGRKVEIVQFGWWNHGAGPDFRDAVVRIDGEPRRGSIELDVDARDWERHGHGQNAAYDDVALHLFLRAPDERFFTRTATHREVAQVLLAPGEAIGPGAPPPNAHPGRCSAAIRTWPAGRIEALFASAARYRLERKAAVLRRTAIVHGDDEALFQAVAEALGYSRNKLPMKVLAQRFPLRFLHQHKATREALLFGAAGFLESVSFEQTQGESRAYLRGLWEQWWKQRAESSARTPLRWDGSGTRPVNHPQRRVAALSETAAHWKSLSAAFRADGFDEKSLCRRFESLSHPYWDYHYTLTSAASPRRMALVGRTRSTDILANVAIPWLVAENEDLWARYCQLPAALGAEKIDRARVRILGGRVDAEEFSAKLYHQQALLQIYADFCLVDASDCAQCPFPEQLNRVAGPALI